MTTGKKPGQDDALPDSSDAVPYKDGAVWLWKFADGTSFPMPLVDVVKAAAAQRLKMSRSGDPGLREAGEEAIERIELERLVEMVRANKSEEDSRLAIAIKSQTSSENARKLRPGALRPIKAKVTKLMRRYQAEGMTFKVFLRTWEGEMLDGLRLAKIDDQNYSVVDENGDDATHAAYKFGSLRTMYSPSTKKKRERR